MCSSTLGPAKVPSLVTWPTRNTDNPVVLAWRMMAEALCRTCDTLPGADELSEETMVWILSITSTSGPSVSHFFQNAFHAVFRQYEKLILLDVQALCAHLDLAYAFFPADIEHLPGLAELCRDLQQECGFSDARIAAQQRDAAFGQPAAQHPVQLLVAG